MASRPPPTLALEDVLRLWFHRQGLATPRGEAALGKAAFTGLLERTGGLQLDSVNVVDRAHWLTLWSRFGDFDRRRVERWVYRDRAAFEYWAHEACILPAAHLPVARRRMKRIPELWAGKSWWQHFNTSTASRRRVLRRLRAEGPLESTDFERGAHEPRVDGGWGSTLPKEDKRTLQFLWHSGRIGVSTRRHFRRVYDLAERIYPPAAAATRTQEEDAWLLRGLSGNGVASLPQLVGYVTASGLKAADRRRVLERHLRKRTVVEVALEGRDEPYYALPEHLDLLTSLEPVRGTTLLSPFDSFLWQRRRAEELLGFRYRVEIYVPEAKREHGYYVLPVLHDGRLVGRVDPKLHRDRGVLEIRRLSLEPDGERNGEPGVAVGAGAGRARSVARARGSHRKGDLPRALTDGLRESLESLATFLGAEQLELPRGWRGRLG